MDGIFGWTLNLEKDLHFILHSTKQINKDSHE